jgi:prepilin-type N-terminal cleavage/methylation domain-containing protein
MKIRTKHNLGFTLVEVIVVSAIMSLFFFGLFEGIRYLLSVISDTQEKAVALSVANEEMEYIHSLSYDAVGTVAGIPPGAIPQNSTTTLNGINFQRKVLVQYVDDAGDGLAGSDSNAITTDYKQAKVTVTWTLKGVTKSLFVVSNIIPPSIETSAGGGTLRVNVFNASVQPMSGASVRVVNNTVVPHIDVTKNTDATGVALFGGAPAGPNYEIYVSRTGYSGDQTYTATTSLPHPTTQPVAVIASGISTMNFFIDQLASLTTRTLSAQTVQLEKESFSDSDGVATSTRISFNGGVAKLKNISGAYVSDGNLMLDRVTPSSLVKWGGLSIASTIPSNTTLLVKIYTGTSTLTLVPDAVLPGNSSGFSLGQIDISMIDPTLYPTLTVGAALTSSNSAVTPNLDAISLTYYEAETAVSGVTLGVIGAKTIGTDAGGGPVYKHSSSVVTSAGKYIFPTIEWDDYLVTPSGYDVAIACPANPISVKPAAVKTQDLLLAASSANTYRVVVETSAHVPITNANVTLSRTGYSQSVDTRNCGQAFFSGLTAASDYQLDVSVDGYITKTETTIDISGDDVHVVQF